MAVFGIPSVYRSRLRMMPFHRYFALVLLGFGLFHGVWGQEAGSVFSWGADPVWDPQWGISSSNSTEILVDARSIRVRNEKPQFIAFFFEHRRVVRYGDRNAIVCYAPVVLPESFDPPFDRHDAPYTAAGSRPFPKLFNLRVDHFGVRVVRPDGSWTELPVEQLASGTDVQGRAVMLQTQAITFYPQGIMPGDVVEYRWKYMLPWDSNEPYTRGWRGSRWVDNWSRLSNWRIFFHHALPIREQTTELDYNAKHGLVITGAVPDEQSNEGNQRVAYWKRSALPGIMDEVHARPSTEVEAAIIAFQPEDLRYLRRERLSGLPIEQQPWLHAIRFREAKAIWWERVSKKRMPDRQNMLIERFVASECGSVDPEEPVRCLEKLHERIAQDFIYMPDREWYLDLDMSLARMGDQVEEERLRDISRFDLYCKLINATQLPYVTAYLLDARSGSLDDRFTTPMHENEWLFGVLDGEKMLWMHPKRMRHGWFANELPFYWEGTSALLVDRQRLISDDPEPPLFVELPTTVGEANVRGIEHRMEVDLLGATVHDRVRTYLSGQFSTLGRAAFLGSTMDPTVNTAYGHVPAALDGTRMLVQHAQDVVRDAPYRFRDEVEFELVDRLVDEGQGVYSIDLRPFIAHAVPHSCEREGRDLSFHWDFAQTDQFILDLKFEQPVDIMDLTRFELDMSSSGARYVLSAEVISASEVRIRSRFSVHNAVESPQEAGPIADILDAIHAQDRTIRVVLK